MICAATTNSEYHRQGIGREELDRLIDMLDDEEVEIIIDYLSNFLLSRVTRLQQKTNHA